MRLLVRRSLVLSTLLVGAAATAVSVSEFGCSSSGDGSGTAPGSEAPVEGASTPTGSLGKVGVDLTLPGGEQLNTVSWTLTGPNGASTVVQSGSVNVQNSLTISFVVGGIPSGSGYAISLSGTLTDGSSSCIGSAQFSVTARTTTNVSVQLQCSQAAPDSGSAQITGTTFDCATWSSVSAIPSETIVGNSVTVSASAIAPNASALTYAWSVPSGSFATPNAPTTLFTCTAPGPVTLTVTMGDGPTDGGVCNPALDTTTVQITCDGHIDAAQAFPTATKIKHLVVIFGENNSFDHYFGTYPYAQNNPGETAFAPAPGTPSPNGLTAPLDPTHGFAPLDGGAGFNLLTNNPNLNPTNGTGAANPFRLSASQAATEDMNHSYAPEQLADDNGAMDLFPVNTGTAGPPPDAGPVAHTKGEVMAYFDGNTMSTYWGYAQNYALNDNAWTTTFGPSTPGALNLISGQTNGIVATANITLSTYSSAVPDGVGGWTLIGDGDPLGDVCSTLQSGATDKQIQMGGLNIGNLLNAATSPISWGWFQGGFDLTLPGNSGCELKTPSPDVPYLTSQDPNYIQHHEPFQYYPSTANPTHVRPVSDTVVGTNADVPTDGGPGANHQYDSHDFFDALAVGNLPAVVYLKAPAYQDGHPGYSNPIDEQNFAASVISALQSTQEWSSTAVVITYDDSDGWYDHQMPDIVNQSNTASDAINGAGHCNIGAQQDGGVAPTTPLLGIPPTDGGVAQPAQGRCGYATRVPMMVISPFAKRNFVDHTLVDQTSVLRFVEDNWLGGTWNAATQTWTAPGERIQPGGSFDTIANPITNMLTGI